MFIRELICRVNFIFPWRVIEYKKIECCGFNLINFTFLLRNHQPPYELTSMILNQPNLYSIHVRSTYVWTNNCYPNQFHILFELITSSFFVHMHLRFRGNLSVLIHPRLWGCVLLRLNVNRPYYFKSLHAHALEVSELCIFLIKYQLSSLLSLFVLTYLRLIDCVSLDFYWINQLKVHWLECWTTHPNMTLCNLY